MSVAAGAVAAAMAPKVKTSGISTWSGKIKWRQSNPRMTQIEASPDSKTVIQRTRFPTERMALNLKEDPIEKAMKPRAISETQLR